VKAEKAKSDGEAKSDAAEEQAEKIKLIASTT